MAVIAMRSMAAITPAMMATGIAVDIPFPGPTGTVKVRQIDVCMIIILVTVMHWIMQEDSDN